MAGVAGCECIRSDPNGQRSGGHRKPGCPTRVVQCSAVRNRRLHPGPDDSIQGFRHLEFAIAAVVRLHAAVGPPVFRVFSRRWCMRNSAGSGATACEPAHSEQAPGRVVAVRCYWKGLLHPAHLQQHRPAVDMRRLAQYKLGPGRLALGERPVICCESVAT